MRFEAPSPCKICGGQTTEFGSKPGKVIATVYRFSRCETCRFISVINPCLAFAELYNENYYKGEGADPLVDYFFELDHPDQTIRHYEWRGISRVVATLAGGQDSLSWLDWGCGNGGLVRYRRSYGAEIVGFDEGDIVPWVRKKGIPLLARSEIDESSL